VRNFGVFESTFQLSLTLIIPPIKKM